MREIWVQLLGVSTGTWDIILASWAASTAHTYEVVAKKWLAYTSLYNVNPTTPDVYQCLEFLTRQYDTGVGYSTINTSRSFLSAFITIGSTPLGEHPLIVKFVKGTKRKRPPGGKIKSIWDPVPVLNHLRAWGDIQSLSYDRLTQRTLLLFLLATGQRLQALFLMLRKDMAWGENCLTITYSTRMKSNDPSTNPLVLNFTKHVDEELCIYSHLKVYVADPRSFKAEPYVVSTIRQPSHRASANTISKIVRNTLTILGVAEEYTAYSARHASTSAAARANIPIPTILASAGWAAESTFAAFYQRPLHTDTPDVVNTDFIPHIVGM